MAEPETDSRATHRSSFIALYDWGVCSREWRVDNRQETMGDTDAGPARVPRPLLAGAAWADGSRWWME
jgi:hypothetical protein